MYFFHEQTDLINLQFVFRFLNPFIYYQFFILPLFICVLIISVLLKILISALEENSDRILSNFCLNLYFV